MERETKNEKRKTTGAIALLSFSFFLFHFSFISGCIPKNPPKKPPYTGPTETMSEVVAAINQNNEKLPTLWASFARNGFDAAFTDDKGKKQDIVLGGFLLYRAPREVRLVGRHDVAGEVLQIGSNRDLYWMIAKDPGPDTAWWGRYKHLGKPCAKPIPVRPDLVLEVLGVGTVNEDFLSLPAPVMRFNNDADAYMMTWNALLPDRWASTKEVWYDRTSKRPTAVFLFDENGRIVLRAWLTQHKPVEVPELPRDQWPTVATEYRLYFPDSGSKLHLRLDELRLTHKNAPNDSTFRFNPQTAGVANVIQIDEDCGE